MYATGDFIESGQKFNTELCGPRTARFMDFVSTDLGENQWDTIFISLSAFSRQTTRQQAVDHGEPEAPQERVPLPASDPPSPPNDA